MSRYYSYETIRNNAKDVILENGVKHRCIDPGALLDIEPADVRENVKGEWEEITNETEEWYWHPSKCSVCGAEMLLSFDNFCPNCGADMRADMRGEA